MSSPIKVLLADDHPVYRDGLRQILAADKAFVLVHETNNGTDALAQARKLKPDVLLLDVDMPGGGGLEVARARQRESLPCEIVFLTMYAEEDMFREAMDLGAKGYVLKDSAAADIRQAIHTVAAGRHYISPSLSGFLVSRDARAQELRKKTPELETLTPAERRVLKLIASDKTSKEIADELGLSPRTVDNHRANICAKLSLSGSHSLLKFAFENRSKL
jgi:DNA-binding NarL/FixJ family response regulator